MPPLAHVFISLSHPPTTKPPTLPTPPQTKQTKHQATIRREFADCTVLTIAHRLETILDSDRILVMSQGRLAEFDRPAALLNRRDSLFAELVRASEQELQGGGKGRASSSSDAAAAAASVPLRPSKPPAAATATMPAPA